MWKILVVIAVFILLQVHPLQPQTPAQSGDHTAKAQTQQKPIPQPATINNVDNRQTCDECSKKDPVATQDSDKWIRRGFWINFILTLVTLVIAGATWLQAGAAKKQASHIVASERAWILETICFPFDKVPYQGPDTGAKLEIPMAKVWIKNQGKSVARIRDFRLRFHTVPDSGKMPTFPDYARTKKPQELGLDGIMGAPTEEHDMPVALEDITLSRETADKVERGEIGLWLYGFVEYDTFGEQRITQFCYVWTPSIGLGSAASKPGLRKSGPENYNRTT